MYSYMYQITETTQYKQVVGKQSRERMSDYKKQISLVSAINRKSQFIPQRISNSIDYVTQSKKWADLFIISVNKYTTVSSINVPLIRFVKSGIDRISTS